MSGLVGLLLGPLPCIEDFGLFFDLVVFAPITVGWVIR